MLDVHPPHEAAHSWRDFFIHIATIVIGLLIAISLEQTVEYIHHRHLVAEARENIEREIHENQELLPRNLASIQQDATQMKLNIETIRQLRAHPHNLQGSIHYNLTWSSFSDSAWHTARDTGALNYMPYDEVQHFSQVYAQQQYVNSLGIAVFTDQGKASGPIFAEGSIEQLTPNEVDQLMGNTTSLYVQLQSLEEILGQLQHDYTEATHH